MNEPVIPENGIAGLLQPVANTNYKQDVVEDSISQPEASNEASTSASAAGDYSSFWDKKQGTAIPTSSVMSFWKKLGGFESRLSKLRNQSSAGPQLVLNRLNQSSSFLRNKWDGFEPRFTKMRTGS